MHSANIVPSTTTRSLRRFTEQWCGRRFAQNVPRDHLTFCTSETKSSRVLPNWLYSKPRPVQFPLWLLAGDIVEIGGRVYVFRGLIRRFKRLDDLHRHFQFYNPRESEQ
ncbi:hypothetical protein SAMN02745126_04515 [Enhydrobacter aerosaccus]|uniref:Uncharacterized protein n=1 Tax=Enhydrobacter aerosaccus TaxID=225324 RepID=A0A1T4SAS0_9HYPH|nr:hypothetical protein [Enhydrobacter aerosaccus]SKA25339.1 hypothetical protein SAMN02745126_04515 [Enhydrobacter aerosaccus]